MRAVVTVGICVKNGEKMLPNAIDSILNQSYPQEKIQLIIVDDGSTDKTPQILKKYVEALGDRARAFKSSWQGLGCARNFIVSKSDGKYLLFVDADEILTRDYVKTQVEVMENNPQVGITAGVFKTVQGNLILNLEVAPNIVNQKSYGKPKRYLLKTDKLIGTGGTTFRITAIRQVQGFDETIKGAGEDIDLVLRIKKAGWLIEANNAELIELHGGLSTPHALLKKYYWYGYGCQRSFQKTRGAFSVPRMSPIAGLVTGLLYSFPAYKFLGQKQMFLLPLHYGLKLTAWTYGFMKGQLKQN
jgi:glycosyltransferase involved in cell wall biosynthesis